MPQLRLKVMYLCLEVTAQCLQVDPFLIELMIFLLELVSGEPGILEVHTQVHPLARQREDFLVSFPDQLILVALSRISKGIRVSYF